MSDKESRMLHVRMSPELHKRVRIRAAEEDKSMQEWMLAVIEKELSKAVMSGGVK